MATEELKALFAAGKYPSATDYAHLIDAISSGGGDGIKIFEIDPENVYEGGYYLESAATRPWTNLPKHSICVHLNTTSDTVRVFLGYSNSDKYVDVAAGSALMVIRTNDTDEYSDWAAIGEPVSGHSSVKIYELDDTLAATYNNPDSFFQKDGKDFYWVAYDSYREYPWTKLPKNSIIVFVNVTENPIFVGLSYNSEEDITLEAGEAVMVIKTSDTGDYLESQILTQLSSNTSTSNSSGGSGIQTIVLNSNDAPEAFDVLTDKGILLRDTALNSLFVFKNGTSSVYNLTIDYSGRAVAISPGDAVMLIYNGYVGAQGDPQFGIVSMSISN